MISAAIKRLYSPEVRDLAAYIPAEASNFGFLLQVIAGPAGEAGEESFDVMVCTPNWLSDKLGSDGTLLGRHHLLINHYDYPSLERFIADYCSNCRGETWSEVAEQLGRLGKWEFEDYRS
jgi:hypothetical protein